MVRFYLGPRQDARHIAYSYCNCNFRIVSELIESETRRSLPELYAGRIFAPAGMKTVELTPDTRTAADCVVGYKGNDATGFFPAMNGIYWIGDAGISASLDDMLAWECHIDKTRDEESGLYRRLSASPAFADGTPAAYGYGLSHEAVAGVCVTGHRGALRGFHLKPGGRDRILQRVVLVARHLFLVHVMPGSFDGVDVLSSCDGFTLITLAHCDAVRSGHPRHQKSQ